MKKYLPYFASKNMKIAYNFYAIFIFFFILIFWLIFPLQKISKNNNIKTKTSKFRINNIFGQISNKIKDFLGAENAQFFKRKT